MEWFASHHGTEVLSHMDGGEVKMGNKVDSGDNGLRGSCPTLDSLIALGFEPRKTGVQVEEVKAVCYRFACLDLDARHVMNLYARQVILLSGVLNTGRTLATIESQIPDDLGNAFEAAAWVSYALKITQVWTGALARLVSRRRGSLGPRAACKEDDRGPGKAAGLPVLPKVLYRQGLRPAPSAQSVGRALGTRRRDSR